MTAKAVAAHFGMSLKLLGGVLWGLRSAGIVDSRPGWHGGFRLAASPETISLQAVIAAASGGETPLPLASGGPQEDDTSTGESVDGAAALVAGFWWALDLRVRETLTSFTVADLAAARLLQ